MSFSRRAFLVSSTASIVTLYFCGKRQKTLKIGVPSLLWNSFIDASFLERSLEQLGPGLEEANYATIELHSTQNIYEEGFDLYFTSLSLPPLKQAQDPIFPILGAAPIFHSVKDKENFLNESDTYHRLQDIYARLGYQLDYLSSIQTQNYCLMGSHHLPIASVKWSWNQFWKIKGMAVLPLATKNLPHAIKAHRIGLTDYFSNEYTDYLLTFNSAEYKKIKIDIMSIHSFVVLVDRQSDLRKNSNLYSDLKNIFRNSLVYDRETDLPIVQSIFSPDDVLDFKKHYQSRVLEYFSEKNGRNKILT